MFSDGSNDARTYKTNETDGDHKNFEQQHTIAPMVPIEKKVTLALCRLKKSMPRSKLVILRKPERIYVKLDSTSVGKKKEGEKQHLRKPSR